MPTRTPPPEEENDFLNTAASGFFLFWSIPSIYFFYEVIKSLINNEKVDGLYLIFSCINLFIMFIYLFPLFMNYLYSSGIYETPIPEENIAKTSKEENQNDNNV
jgi:hypothetical protein